MKMIFKKVMVILMIVTVLVAIGYLGTFVPALGKVVLLVIGGGIALYLFRTLIQEKEVDLTAMKLTKNEKEMMQEEVWALPFFLVTIILAVVYGSATKGIGGVIAMLCIMGFVFLLYKGMKWIIAMGFRLIPDMNEYHEEEVS